MISLQPEPGAGQKAARVAELEKKLEAAEEATCAALRLLRDNAPGKALAVLEEWLESLTR